MGLTVTGTTEDIDYQIWVGTIATVVPATIAVILRFIWRHISRAGFWWDDWVIVASLIVNWAMAALRWVEVLRYNFGRHGDDIPVQDIVEYQKSFMAIQLVYFTNAVLTKSSFLLLYQRIFGIVKTFRYALAVSWFLIIGYFVSCVIASIVGCSPVSYLWGRFRHPSEPGSCFNEIAFFRWNGFANMALDILILFLPLPMVWRMRLDTRRKVLLTGVFLMGGFVCIVSLLRILSFDSADRTDPTYTQIPSSTWSSVEQGTGIICACLPTLRPLQRLFCGAGGRDSFRRLSRRLSSHSSDHSSNPSSGVQGRDVVDVETGNATDGVERVTRFGDEDGRMRRWADDDAPYSIGRNREEVALGEKGSNLRFDLVTS
ncbi:hypothetical protein BDV18DRAFT_54216 [Aspergillus unguis]